MQEHFVKPRRGLAFVLVGVAYVGAIGLAFWLERDWMARQTWAVIATGATVIWYTWETMLLRETAAVQAEIALRQRDATLEQIEVQIRPFVIMEFASPGFTLRNIGSGPALNVRVHTVSIDPVNDVEVRFKPVFPVIPPGAGAVLEAAGYQGERFKGDFFAAHLDPRYAVHPLDVTVSYENVEGREYLLVHAVGPESVRIRGLKSQKA